MPNWCRNEVKINGNIVEQEAILDFLKESIERFQIRLDEAPKDFLSRSKLQRELVDFNNVIPYPEHFLQRDNDKETLSKKEFFTKYGDEKDGYNNGGYAWCVANWGTKWNASDAIYVPQLNCLFFETAWGPALKVIAALHKHFPTVGIYYEYYERGSGFIGGGEFIREEDWDESYYTAEEVHSIEMQMKLQGTVKSIAWEAGRVYNPWSSEYMGFKGG